MNNSRFAISVHILTLLQAFPDEVMSSEKIAGSINVNPVIIRKELAQLQRSGLVESREGKNGGSRLARPASKILLSDVYTAVHTGSVLGKQRNDPNPDCIVGRQINRHLDELYEEIDTVLVQRLKKISLADFAKKFK